MDVNIIQFPATRIAVLQHRGSPDPVNATAARFYRMAQNERAVASRHQRNPGHCPGRSANNAGRRVSFLISAAPLSDRLAKNAFGVINGEIPAGRCAVARHHGSLDTLAQSVWFLYRDWLPASGETLRDFSGVLPLPQFLCMKLASMNSAPIFIYR